MLIIYNYITNTNYLPNVSGPVPAAVGTWVGMLTSHVFMLCRSCSLLTIHYLSIYCSVLTIPIFTASVFTDPSLLHWSIITAHLYHCSLFTELEWHLYTSTEIQCRVPTPVRLAVAKLRQRQSYGICILMSIGRKLWNYMSTWGAPGTHCRAGACQLSGYELLSLDM